MIYAYFTDVFSRIFGEATMVMATKCLTCGHVRHDVALNCPKCGSFYSQIDFVRQDSPLTEKTTHEKNQTTQEKVKQPAYLLFIKRILKLFR